MRWFASALVAWSAFAGLVRAENGWWPQFRGPHGSGLADPEQKLPDEIGPDRNVVWKVPLPPGHSSPIVQGDRIYLTAVRGKALLTLALDRHTGSVFWEDEAPYQKLEKIHQIGSHAQPSPVTDGQYVISYFGSSGLLCYDTYGKRLWHFPLGPYKNDLGAGSSPVLAGNVVLVSQDNDVGSFLLAVDKRTGRQLWKTDRAEFTVGYATPVLWDVAGKKQVVVAGTLRAVGYDLETGAELWTVRGLSRAVHMTPSVGPDNTLYVAAWTPGGDDGDRIDVAPFAQMLARYDTNRNGTLEDNEIPDGPLKSRFSLIDRDKDGHITKQEFEHLRHIFNTAQNRIVAIKPGGHGDITTSHVLWSQKRYLPVVPSPLYYRGLIYLMRNGALLATLDAKTGKLLKHERVPGGGDYYSSPVGGDGKVYLVSERGDLAVVSAGPQWQVLSRSRFGENVYATPALVDGRIFLRTAGHLYCFGLQP
jgi:outer membrane protein assembly factor BamB